MTNKNFVNHDTAKGTFVFVYGSLMHNMHNNGVLHGDEQTPSYKVCDAEMSRDDMHTKAFHMLEVYKGRMFGGFPGIVECSQDQAQTIKGELWFVSHDTKARLDRFEGVCRRRSDNGLYRNHWTSVRPVRGSFVVIDPDTANNKVQTWVYVYNHNPHQELRKVANGDWRAWVQAQRQEAVVSLKGEAV